MSVRVIKHKNRLPKIAKSLGYIPSWQLPSIIYALTGNVLYGNTFTNQSVSNLIANGTGLAVPYYPIVYTIGTTNYAITPYFGQTTQTKVYKSTNKGATYSLIGDLKTGFTDYVKSFCTDNAGNYVIASENNTWHSNDGENWTISGTFTATISKVIYCQSAPTINGLNNYFYVMTTSNSEHANSANGLTYSNHTVNNKNYTKDIVWCKELGSFFRASESINLSSQKIAYSKDGFTYSDCSGSGGFEQWATLCYSPLNKSMVGVQVASGDTYENAKIAISTDGQTITKYDAPSELSGAWRTYPAQIAWLPSSKVYVLMHTQYVWTSHNAIDWTKVLDTASLGLPSGTSWFGAIRQHSIITEI